ncbi:autoinducer binding domain-containing protein [Gymnodinialimonas sp. 2305UL16-5]|uniref:helix-turn-helix transcriptional regulator n=1 Tax=Gymnodinialimonas mytili TaxID=3126503 RepID=UPI0030B3279B
MQTPISIVEPYLSIRDAAGLWSKLHEDVEQCGFRRIFYAGARRRSANHDHSPDDTIVKSSYGEEFDRFFIDGNAFTSDVNTQWALYSEGAVSWDLTRRLKSRGQLNPRQVEIHDRCNDLGLVNGYTVSLGSRSTGLVSGYGLSADDMSEQAEVDRIWSRNRSLLLSTLSIFDLVIRLVPDIPNGSELTKRQGEVLEWAGDGKTIDDIAEIMGLHRSTVAKHMSDARARLRVANTLQAVVRATVQGQIYR